MIFFFFFPCQWLVEIPEPGTHPAHATAATMPDPQLAAPTENSTGFSLDKKVTSFLSFGYHKPPLFSVHIVCVLIRYISCVFNMVLIAGLN